MMHLQNTTYDWGYYAEPSKYASKGLKRGTYWPRGKVLGGSSAINAMLYVRGNQRDYDRWEELGNPTWGWKNVLNYFKKSEDMRVEHIMGDTEYHSTGGLLKIDAFYNTEQVKIIIADSILEQGFEQHYDLNTDQNLGFASAHVTMDHGTRCSTAKAFLNPAKDRTNLHIIKHAHVTKIAINKDDKSIEGVDFTITNDNKNKKLTAKAKKEIILSAGAVNTPQILKLSGVGPIDELQKLNIDVVKNLPVGNNLQDHLIVPFVVSYRRSWAPTMENVEHVDDYYTYIMHTLGFYNTIGVTDYIGFVNSRNDSIKYPDIQFHFYLFKKQDEDTRFILNLFGYIDEIVDSICNANKEAEIVLVLVTLLNPKSKGKIELRSTDPFDTPKIFPNYLTEQDDIDTVLRGIRILRKMTKGETFKVYEGEEVAINIPNCSKIDYDTDEYWECYIRHMSITVYHPVGTAKMGPETDKESVVDSKLRVHGIKGLRVIDASIMPNIVSGNTNAPTIMIAEKGSDFIKSEHYKMKIIVNDVSYSNVASEEDEQKTEDK